MLVANVFDPTTITLDPDNGVTAIKLLTKACWSTVGISFYWFTHCSNVKESQSRFLQFNSRKMLKNDSFRGEWHEMPGIMC